MQDQKSYSIFGVEEDGQSSSLSVGNQDCGHLISGNAFVEPGTGGSTPSSEQQSSSQTAQQRELPNTWVLEWHTARLQAIEGRLNVIDRRISQTSDRISVVIDAALGSSGDELRVLVTERCSSMSTALERLSAKVDAQQAAMDEIYWNARNGSTDADHSNQNLSAWAAGNGGSGGSRSLSPYRRAPASPLPTRSCQPAAGNERPAPVANRMPSQASPRDWQPAISARSAGNLLPIEEHPPSPAPKVPFEELASAAPADHGADVCQDSMPSPRSRTLLPTHNSNVVPVRSAGAQFKCGRCGALVLGSQLQKHSTECTGSAEAPLSARAIGPPKLKFGESVDCGKDVADMPEAASTFSGTPATPATPAAFHPPEQVILRCAQETNLGDSVGVAPVNGVQRAVSMGEMSGGNNIASISNNLRRAVSAEWKSVLSPAGPDWTKGMVMAPPPPSPRAPQVSPQQSTRRSLPPRCRGGGAEVADSPMLRTRVLPGPASVGTPGTGGAMSVPYMAVPQTPPASPLVTARMMPMSARGHRDRV